MDSDPLRLAALEAFSVLYEEKGDYKKAREYHQKFKEVGDKVFSERIADSLAKAQTRYEVLRKEKAIEALKNKQALQAIELRRQRFAKRALSAGLIMLLGLLLLQANRNRLAKEVRRLSIVARETENAVAILDAQGKFQWVNEGFVRMFGYTLEEFIEARGDNLTQASFNPEVQDVVRTCIEEKRSVVYENPLTTKSGEQIWTQTTLTPILDAKGNVLNLIAIDTDITKLKQAEKTISEQKEQLQRSNEELTRINRELLELNARQNEFLGIAAHDLRAPLASVCNYADLLLLYLERNHLDREKWAKCLTTIRRIGSQMQPLLDSLLDVSAIESGRLVIHRARTSVRSLLTATYDLHGASAEAKGIEFTMEDPGPDLFVHADQVRIEEVLDNLTSNAIKFTYPGGRVHLRSVADDARVTFFVEDTGQGFREDELDRVFSGKKLSARPTGGESTTGLGLVIVKKVLENHGAEIHVESTHGQGSAFSFTLPRA